MFNDTNDAMHTKYDNLSPYHMLSHIRYTNIHTSQGGQTHPSQNAQYTPNKDQKQSLQHIDQIKQQRIHHDPWMKECDYAAVGMSRRAILPLPSLPFLHPGPVIAPQ